MSVESTSFFYDAVYKGRNVIKVFILRKGRISLSIIEAVDDAYVGYYTSIRNVLTSTFAVVVKSSSAEDRASNGNGDNPESSLPVRLLVLVH
jgi:hypothetical protein